MKIIALVLFGKNKQKRILNSRQTVFRLLSGTDRQGKSSIGKIIDYCFGKDECNVPVGVIRSTVLAYGLWLSNTGLIRSLLLERFQMRGKNRAILAFIRNIVCRSR
jgi:hypothetical protein